MLSSYADSFSEGSIPSSLRPIDPTEVYGGGVRGAGQALLVYSLVFVNEQFAPFHQYNNEYPIARTGPCLVLAGCCGCCGAFVSVSV